MLAELLRLSKELYELEMVEESINIDDMIHKLYGSTTSSLPQVDIESEEESYSTSTFDNLREEIQSNAANESFKSELADIIYESFSASDLEDIRDLITDYLE